MLRIYHNPRCRKSREGLNFLRSKTENFVLIDYMKTGLQPAMIEEILLKSNLEPVQIIRSEEEIFRKQLRGKNFNRHEWIQIICENPNLLQRPLVISTLKAVIAQPPEKINEILNS